MSVTLVNKLLSSFDELDRCIHLTLEVFANNDNISPDIVNRVEQYSAIVTKQRLLAKELELHIERNEFADVSRVVKLINGLSSMIKDDAQAILAAAAGAEVKEGAVTSTENDSKIC